MAKITRYNGNLLAPASSAPGTERTIFGSTSQSDDISTNYSPELLAGWGLIGPNDAPPMQYFNAIAFTLGQVLAYLHQMGVAEWNATQEYHTGSVCVYGGKTWLSTSDSNIGNTPGVSDWVAHIVSADIGVTVQAYDADTAKTDVANVFTAAQTISPASGSAAVILDAAAGNDAYLRLLENGVSALLIQNDASASTSRIQKYSGAGVAVSNIEFDEAGNVNVSQGTFQIGGSNALKASDIGSTVQAYDADTAKTDVANTFTKNQTISQATGGSTLFIDAATGDTAKIELKENGTTALNIHNDGSASKSYIYKYDAIGAAISNFEWSENGDLDFRKGSATSGLFKYNGTEIAVKSFHGALVYRSAVQSISTGALTVILFDSETYDTDGIHDTGSNTSRLTVPAGVSWVKVTVKVDFAASASGTTRAVEIIKNNSAVYAGHAFANTQPTGAFPTRVQATTPVIAVSEGDYFEARAQQDSGGSLNISGGSDGTWFGMEVVV